MPEVEIPAEAARREMERVLQSAGFARNQRLSQFLRYVVERRLEGRDGELKESVIAVEVFGRRPDYNPKQDATVRIEAGRLRVRLGEYYHGEGKDDPVIIDLPKGGYAPVFHHGAEPPAKASGTIRRLQAVAAVVCLVSGLAAIAWWWTQHRSAAVAIAVLPLENLSHDPASDGFADGLTDELIRNLSLIDGLTPRSRTSSFVFKGKPRNVHEVGKQLAVDYILEGSVLREEARLRINVQLIRVRDDFPLWAGRYDRESRDIFAIQDEISRGIVNSLRLKLGPGRRRYETSTDAYDLYLRARALTLQHGMQGYSEAIAPFAEAIAKDPGFAPAYAGLATSYVWRSGQSKFNPAEELNKMRVAASRAIELDPFLAEAHAAMGMAYARDARWNDSEKSFRRAIELDPARSSSYDDFVLNLLLPLGSIKEALQQLRVAERMDPLSPDVQLDVATVLMASGRYAEAADRCQKVPEDYPFRDAWLGRARLGQGRVEEAIELLTKGGQAGYLGYAYARAGRREEAETMAANSPLNSTVRAQIFAGLGDKDRTLEALDHIIALGPVHIGRMLMYPEFALLRGDPRLKDLRKKLGLPM